MFYDVYLALCKKIDKKPSTVAFELGINKSNVSNWKNNGYTPRGEALNKIADYFNVSIDYLLGNEQKNSGEPELNSAFFRLKKGLEPYDLDEEDAEFLLTVFKAHKEKNK